MPDSKCSATFGAFSLGNVIAWPSTALLSLDADIALSDSEENWTVSIFMLGAALVPWLAGQTTSQNSSVFKAVLNFFELNIVILCTGED